MQEALRNPLGLAHSLNEMGVTYQYLGNHTKALEYHKRALEMSKQVYGLEHPHVATVLRNLEHTRHALGDSQVASQANRFIKACREEDSEAAASIPISSLSKVAYQANRFIKACREGDSEAAASIPINSLSKDLYDNEGNPLICWMAQHEMTATLAQVLALGWNPNLPNTNQVYPLHYGAMRNVALTRLLLQAGAHPFVQTAKESTPAMVAKKKENLQTLALLLPAHAMLSFENLATFEASYQAYKEHFTPSTAGNEELLVALELALQLGDASLLQTIGTSKSEGLLSQLAQKYPLGEDAIQIRFAILFSLCSGSGQDALDDQLGGES